MKDILPSTNILGTTVTTASKGDILEYIVKRLKKGDEKFYIVTPNPEIITYATASKHFQKILNGAALSLPDGIGVVMAGKMLKKPIMARITGVDFMQELCKESVKEGLTIGFLGGRDGVAEMTAKCLREKYTGLRVIFASSEWPSFPSQSTSHIDILFVAFGFPKQEEWISKNLPNIDVTAAMGVGGAFDYISGKVSRAPRIVRSVGLEWVFRLVVQPWRIKRQMVLPVFVYKVVREKIG